MIFMKNCSFLKVDWKKRIGNKAFWWSMIPAVLLLFQVIASLFGFEIDLNFLSKKLLAVVNSVFSILVILGVVVDPTTNGWSDDDTKK